MDSLIKALLPTQMKKSFFNEIRFFVWWQYNYDNYFEFLHKDGTIYRIEYSEKLEKVFPVIKNFNNGKDLYNKWYWHYMELGGGVVFIHEEIADTYKKYAGIDGEFPISGPDFDAAIKSVNEIYSNWIYYGARYFLGQPKNNNLLIFGINPSTATPNKLDSTMNHILTILADSKDFSDLGWIMMNIYPQVTPHPEDLKLNKEIMHENFEQIEYILKNFKIENVWCAWGDSIDNLQKDFLKDSLKNIYEILAKYNLKFWCYGGTTQKNNPIHPLYTKRKPLDYEFEEFYIKNYLALKQII